MIYIGADGRYRYIEDLEHHSSDNNCADSRFCHITTPLNCTTWRRRLGHHPDKDFVTCILKGIESGFSSGTISTVAVHQNHELSDSKPTSDR